MTNLYGLTETELEKFVLDKGYKKFAGRQLFQWMYQKGRYDFSDMTNLSKGFRSELENNCHVSLPVVEKVQRSADGTIKYLFRLGDGDCVEAVKIPEYDRLTLCISSQVGCPLGCQFCRTSGMGFMRDLEVGEILAQVAVIRAGLSSEERITNLVFMGMGEPFLNYENIKKAVEILRSEKGFGIGYRKITISTSGHVDGIYRLSDDLLKIRLAISLNCADQDVRRKLMPIANKYPLPELKRAAQYYCDKFGMRVTFEYLMLSGITDTLEMAQKLAEFIKGVPCKINLINYNPAEDMPPDLKPSTNEDLLAFRDYLDPRAPAVTVRNSRGADIKAACGQLAGERG